MVPGHVQVQEGGQPQAMHGHVSDKWVLVLDAGKQLQQREGEGGREMSFTLSVARNHVTYQRVHQGQQDWVIQSPHF